MRNNRKHKIFILSFALLFVLLAVPAHYKFYPVLAAFLLLFTFQPKSFDLKFFLQNTLLYFGLLFTLLYSSNWSYGSSFVFETQALLLIFPLFFSILLPADFPELYRYKDQFFLTYILMVFLYSLSPVHWFFAPYHYDLQKLLFHYPGILNSTDYHLFSIHPVYMSIAVGWAFILSLYLLIKIRQKYIRILLIVLEIYFLGILFLLARMGAILALMLALLLFVYLYKRHVFYRLVLVIILGAGLVFVIPNTRKRINEVLKIEHKDVMKNTSAGKHLRIFKSSWKSFKNSPLTGYGLGSHKDVLIEQYRKDGETDLYKEKYSTHNQYMSFLLIGGIFLLLIYMAMIAVSIRRAIPSKNYLVPVFWVYFGIVMLFENYLEREDGIVVFALFYTYLNYLSHTHFDNSQKSNT